MKKLLYYTVAVAVVVVHLPVLVAEAFTGSGGEGWFTESRYGRWWTLKMEALHDWAWKVS